jgi:hypothetical protein
VTRSQTAPHWTTGWMTAAVWLSAFVWSVAAFPSFNDHFDRISRARQIAVYGEIPFRDFFDPGYFITLFSSAGLQLLLGDNLLGEMLLVTALIASGTTLVFLLARNLSASSTIAVLAAFVALLALPRSYDYDKFFFYPLGVFLCWRYIDQRRFVDIVMLGVGAVAAGVFRYDSGVYVMCAALMTVMVLHAGAVPVLVRRVAALFGVVAIAAIPFLLFLQIHGGLLDAVQQVVTYAQRDAINSNLLSLKPVSIAGPLFTVAPRSRVEVGVRWTPAVDEADRKDAAERYGLSDERPDGEPERRTWLYELEDASTENIRRLISDPGVEDTNGIDRNQATVESRWIRLQRAVPLLRNRVLPGVFHRANAIALLHYLFLAIPLVAAITVWWWPINPDREGRRVERARVLGLVAMCIVTAVFILRDPLPARVGGMVGPAAVLWAWLFSRVRVSSRRIQTGARGEGHARPLVGLLRTTPAIAVGVVVLCLAVSQEWNVHLGRIAGRLPFVAAKLGDVSESPVGPHWMPENRTNALAGYVRDCTGPVDRVLATWFVPELYFFAQRGFAAGMVVTFDGQWSEHQYQQRSVELWSRQSVPIVIVKTDEYEDFRVRHSLLDTYLREHYAVTGRTNFGDPEMNDAGYTVWTHTDRAPVRTHPTWRMPCFA